MQCYRPGGCGPYEMMPCSECPASKPEYSQTGTNKEKDVATKRRFVCPVCQNEEHREGARYCMICGSPLGSCSGCINEESSRDQDCCWNCSRNQRRTRADLYRRCNKKPEEE